MRPVIDPALSSIRISRNNNNERYTCVYIYIIINTILAGTDFSSYIYMRERPKISTSLFFCKSNKVENITCFYSSLEILWLVYVCIMPICFFKTIYKHAQSIARATARHTHGWHMYARLARAISTAFRTQKMYNWAHLQFVQEH